MSSPALFTTTTPLLALPPSNSSLSEEEEPTLASSAPTPCEANVVEPSIVAQVSELKSKGTHSKKSYSSPGERVA